MAPDRRSVSGAVLIHTEKWHIAWTMATNQTHLQRAVCVHQFTRATLHRVPVSRLTRMADRAVCERDPPAGAHGHAAHMRACTRGLQVHVQ